MINLSIAIFISDVHVLQKIKKTYLNDPEISDFLKSQLLIGAKSCFSLFENIKAKQEHM